ncbi:MAG: 7-cyano-7-deazaguanine synthase [bacterium]
MSQDLGNTPGPHAVPAVHKAVVLFSGGLDSTLAAKVLKDQDLEVTALHFSTGFCVWDHKRKMGVKDPDYKKGRTHPNPALQAAASVGVPVEVIDVSDEYLDVVLHPKHGRGNAANPCIDCRIFMLKKAKEVASEIGAEVIATGEVLGQRPMSQHRRALGIIEEGAGLVGRVLRPLSARHLPETFAEAEGVVDRSRLFDISGRGRKPQHALADCWGISGYAQPAGGCCFLADDTYGRRFKDYLGHHPEVQGMDLKGEVNFDRRQRILQDLWLLKVGRHIRVNERLKVIVGRHEGENDLLRGSRRDRHWLWVASHPGPFLILDGWAAEEGRMTEGFQLAASVAAYYSDGRTAPEVTIEYGYGEDLRESFIVPPDPASGEFVSTRFV